jgi:sugar phosphate isomerase/epimerase
MTTIAAGYAGIGVAERATFTETRQHQPTLANLKARLEQSNLEQ